MLPKPTEPLVGFKAYFRQEDIDRMALAAAMDNRSATGWVRNLVLIHLDELVPTHQTQLEFGVLGRELVDLTQ